MAEYTYNDIIIDPYSEEAKNAVGKEVFFDDIPHDIVNMANANANGSVLFLPEVLKDMIPELQYPFRSESGNRYSCIILKKEESYSERSKKWVENNNLKVGDYVKVLRKAKERENGWENVWPSEMDDYIGKTLKVKAISLNKEVIWLKCNGFDFDIPYFVLEKVEEPKPNYVPFESVEEFLTVYFKSVANSECIQKSISSTGIWLKHNDAFLLVVEIWDRGVVISDGKMDTMKIGEDTYLTTNFITDWHELYEKFTFLDGSPCGKEVK